MTHPKNFTSALNDDHVAIVNLDDRRRAQIGRWATREPVKGWRVYRSDDGRQILLEAILDDQ